LGAGILQSLQQQRETIQRAQATQQEANANLSIAQSTLKRMGRWLPWG
jgi:Snare region anchored in the vesicle membrane C-terminus